MLDLDERTALPSTIDRDGDVSAGTNRRARARRPPVVLAIVDYMDLEPGAGKWQAGREW